MSGATLTDLGFVFLAVTEAASGSSGEDNLELDADEELDAEDESDMVLEDVNPNFCTATVAHSLLPPRRYRFS
jgi:hypothetical protein